MTESSQNSLSLLLEYSSSSDTEDADSVKSSPDEHPPHKPKLPLPNELLAQFQPPAQVIDDPTRHGGRLRSFPHERNSWATLVYIPLRRDLTQLFDMLRTELERHGVHVEFIPEPHLSLSKTLVIPHHWINPLVDTLRKELQHLSSITVSFTSVEIFCNEEKTRTFIALGANTCKNSLVNIVQAVDKAAEEFKLPKYYEEPNFHASIAWCVQDKTPTLNPLHKHLNDMFTQFLVNSSESFHLNVKHIHMKTGNKFYSFPLT